MFLNLDRLPLFHLDGAFALRVVCVWVFKLAISGNIHYNALDAATNSYLGAVR
jgi:hypothetical protein